MNLSTLLNAEIKIKDEYNELMKIVDCIESECRNKYFNLEEINKYLNEQKFQYNVSGKKIEIIH